MAPELIDVLIVGAGPGGAAAATHATRAGRHAVLLDAATFPRDKTCGDGLTPRAVHELGALGLGDWLADRPAIRGLRLSGWGADAEIDWPRGAFGPLGSAVTRTELDARLVDLARESGADVRTGVRALGVSGDVLTTSAGDLRFRRLVVADGVRSPIGKSLGRTWHRDTAYGVAGRAYVPSADADSPWMGSDLEIRSHDGVLMPGYGWVFPLGDGHVNIGVGALATAKRPSQVALRPTIERYTDVVRDRWRLDGPPQRVASALLPMGGAVSGVSGPSWALIGDAAACVNPLNGEGIDYALETARLVVDALDEELTTAWPALLRERYGVAFSAARRLAGLLTVPRVVPLLGRPGLRSHTLMSAVVRIMGNLVTDADADLLARAWRAAGGLSTRVDERPPFS